MRMRVFHKSSMATVAFIAGVFLFAQDATYLTQKLMVEKDIRERVTTALSKLMKPSQFVVHVDVDLELSDAVQEEVTFAGDTDEVQATAAQKKVAKKEETGTKGTSGVGTSSMTGLPIPGFEFEVQQEAGQDTEAEAEPLPEEVREAPVNVEKKDKILSRTSSKSRPAIARIIRKAIQVILQEDTPPELLENVRTIVTATAGLNVSGGDKLTITTASFKERREAKKAEQVMLQTIADKIQNMEQKQQAEGQAREQNWQDELKRYRDDEAKRREEDRQYFKQQLSQLEQAAKQRAFEKEKKRILRKDSLQISQLDFEIQQLKAQLNKPNEDSTAVATTQLSQKEQERQELDNRLEAKISELNQVQTDIDRLNKDMEKTPTMSIVLIAILGSLLLILLIVLIFILMNRSKHQPPYPPYYMPPPRRKKKRPKPTPPAETPQAAAPQPAPQPVPAQPEAPKASVEDQAVLSSEIGDMRQAVVSMSVGQPHTATRIVKEWMQQEAPPPPPEPETPAPEAEEEDTGKKKRKK